MDKGKKEILSVRIISTVFSVVTLMIFKPFGLDAWQWMAYVHLVLIGVLGVFVCVITEGILKYLVRKPRSVERGVSYIIRRNLWFQLINTPLVSLMICLYRHFILSNRVESNMLSLSNFLETLLIMTFCSFAIGLYWRFKFRSKFLAVELEETKMLNEQLKQLQNAQVTQNGRSDEMSNQPERDSLSEQQPSASRKVEETIVLSGTTSETVTLHIPSLLYIEAVGNYVKVYQLRDGQVHTDMLRATSKQIEDDLQAYPMIIRCHRAFLVNLQQVEQIVSNAGTMQLLMNHCHEYLPVSRSNMAQVKEAIKGMTVS